MTQTAYSARCEANTRSGDGCKNPALSGDRFCPGHHPDRARERVRIASAGGRPGSCPAPDIGEEELAARNKALARENRGSAALDTLIDTRAKQDEGEPPTIDRQRAQDAIRSARTRRAWAEWHRAPRRSATGPP